MENLLNETVMIKTGQIADLTRIESYFSIVAPEIETKIDLLIKEVQDNHILESNLKYSILTYNRLEGLRVKWSKEYGYIEFFNESVITDSELNRRKRSNLKRAHWLTN